MMINSHHKAYVCIHVFNDKSPIKLVSRPKGDWCFLCGEEHDEVASSYRVVGIGHMFQKDPSLHELQDLPEDWEAERENIGKKWIWARCNNEG